MQERIQLSGWSVKFAMNENQYKFYTCQKCHKMVEKVYQKGYCRACLGEHFRSLRKVINLTHPLQKKITSPK